MGTILDGIDLVVQYIMIYGPVLVSVITMISTVIVAIKKCKSVSNDSLKQTRVLKEEMNTLASDISEVARQNVKLLEENRQLKASINKINIKEK